MKSRAIIDVKVIDLSAPKVSPLKKLRGWWHFIFLVASATGSVGTLCAVDHRPEWMWIWFAISCLMVVAYALTCLFLVIAFGGMGLAVSSAIPKD